VGLYQLAIVVGILVVFLVNWLIQGRGTHAWNVESGWRWMFGSLVIPAGLFWLLLLFVPESPRWLLLTGRTEEAMKVLERLNGPGYSQNLLPVVRGPMEQAAAGEVWAPAWRRPLLVGVALAVFSQISGINAVMYYAPEIFKSAGNNTGSAFAQSIAIGAVNLVFTLVALALVDRSGRRRLLLVGTSVQAVSLGAAALYFGAGTQGAGVLIALVVFVAAFAVSTGPVTWIAISEIFPNRLRGRAMSLAVLCLWAADWAVTQSFPMLKAAVGPEAIFWLYAGCSAFCLACLAFIMPETKNRSLEEIEAYWHSRHATSLERTR
jgi:SP family arabinose:H+ symporter-like MFS transporter